MVVLNLSQISLDTVTLTHIRNLLHTTKACGHIKKQNIHFKFSGKLNVARFEKNIFTNVDLPKALNTGSTVLLFFYF